MLLVVVEIEELLAPDEPVDTQHALLAPSSSGMSDTAVGVVAARAGTPAEPVAPPTAPCETSGRMMRMGMADRTREMLLAEQTPEPGDAGVVGVDVETGGYVFGIFCRAASRGAIDRTLYG